MTETELTYLVLGSIALTIVNAIRAAAWKARYETLDKERGDNMGWRNEALFLRRVVNESAADAVEYDAF